MSLFNGVAAKDIDGKVVQLETVAKKVTLVTNGTLATYHFEFV